MSLVSNDSSGNIIGIDNKRGNLIKIANDKPTTIYPGVIKDYYINKDRLVLIDNNNLNTIVIRNPVNQTVIRNINLSDFSPIISVTIDNDNQNLYFLGNFNIDTKTPVLYLLPINNSEPLKLTETQAQKIEYMNDDILLLIEDFHSIGKGSVVIYDVKNETTISKQKADSHNISPNKNKLLLLTVNKISILESPQFALKTKIIDKFSSAIWKDNKTVLLFKNDNYGINYAKLDTDTMELSPFEVLIREASIRAVYGIMDNKLYIQDYKKGVISVDVP